MDTTAPDIDPVFIELARVDLERTRLLAVIREAHALARKIDVACTCGAKESDACQLRAWNSVVRLLGAEVVE